MTTDSVSEPVPDAAADAVPGWEGRADRQPTHVGRRPFRAQPLLKAVARELAGRVDAVAGRAHLAGHR